MVVNCYVDFVVGNVSNVGVGDSWGVCIVLLCISSWGFLMLVSIEVFIVVLVLINMIWLGFLVCVECVMFYIVVVVRLLMFLLVSFMLLWVNIINVVV